jgi:sec-independent protein translocase protein TatA
MGSFSLIHWIILAVVIMLLFGGNRFSAMMSDVAKGLKSFKKGLSEEDEERARDQQGRDQQGRDQQGRDQRTLPPQGRAPEQPIDVTPRRPSTDTVPPRDDERTSG